MQGLGLSYNDVEEVLPVYDFLQAWRAGVGVIYRLAFLSVKIIGD